MLRNFIENKIKIDAEVEEGNIEYKLRLDLKDKHHIHKTATQLVWRLNEGKNIYGKWIARYFLGIDDDGSIGQVNLEIINTSLDILHNIATRCNAEITFVDKIEVDKYYVAEVIIEKIIDDKIIAKDIRVCVLGDTNSGKTTCISNILYKQVDDGMGYARNFILKHKHEKKTGVTSSIKHDIIGYKKGNIITYKSSPMITWESIMLKSEYVISIFDLPGSSKYISTTYYGIMSLKPHYIFIVIDISEISKLNNYLQFIDIALASNITPIILFTKKDLVQDNIDEKINIVQNYISTFSEKKLMNILDEKINNNIPYLLLSNKEDNTEIFIHLFHILVTCKKEKKSDYSSVFNIIEVYNIPDKGIIVSGICTSGLIEHNKTYYIGPLDTSNKYVPIKIVTIHKKQISCNKINYDESGSLELQNITNISLNMLNKNMQIISADLLDKVVDDLCIYIDSKYTNIVKETKLQIYVNNIVDTFTVSSMEKIGDKIKLSGKIIKKYVVLQSNLCILKYDDQIILGTIY